MKTRDNLLYSILLLITVFYFGSLFDFMFVQTDSKGYLNAIDILSGREASEDRLHRLSKPLSLVFPSLLTIFFSIKTETALYCQQILTYLISVFLFVKINKLIFCEDRWIEIKSVILLIGCQCFVIYALSLMIDGIAWSIELFAIWYYLSQIDKYSGIYKHKFYWLGLILGLGFFVKETIFISGLFVFIHILASKNSNYFKVLSLLKTGLVFMLVVFLGTIISIMLFQKSMLNWWEFALEDKKLFALNLKDYFVQLYRSLDTFWFLVLLGVFYFFKKAKINKNPILLSLLITAVLSIIIFPFLWFYRTDRILFMMSMLLLPFANMVSFKKSIQLPVVISVGAFINLFMTYRIYKFAESGWILLLSLIFLTFLLLNVLLRFVPYSSKIKD